MDGNKTAVEMASVVATQAVEMAMEAEAGSFQMRMTVVRKKVQILDKDWEVTRGTESCTSWSSS